LQRHKPEARARGKGGTHKGVIPFGNHVRENRTRNDRGGEGGGKKQ